MKKIAASILCALTIGSYSFAPAQAADGDTLKKVGMFPVTIVAFTAGVVFGTPIAVVRKSFGNTKETIDKVAGSDGHPVKKLAASIIALPVGVFTGTAEGLWLGPANSLAYDGDNPFGKERFSLGDLDK